VELAQRFGSLNGHLLSSQNKKSMPSNSDRELAILNCGQLVTLAGPARPRVRSEMRELSIIPDGAMLVRGPRIEAIGTRAEIEPLLSSRTNVIDARKRVVLPGFVDAHTHPVFAGNRADEFEQRAAGKTYQEIAAEGGGIRSTVHRTRQASEKELFDAGRRYQEWFLRCGTTTIEAKSGYGLSLDAERKLLHVIRSLDAAGPLRYVPTFLGAHDVPDEYRGKTQEYVRLIVHEMLPEIAKNRLAEYCDVFCEPGIFDVPASAEILRAARQLGLGIRVHADQLTRSGAAEMAAEAGAATADHLEQIDNSGIAALARANVQPVLLPASVYCLGSERFAPARKMIENGLAVVLATDFNPGSSPTPSIPFVLSLAATHMWMTPAEAIVASTVNAAYSVGRGSALGSLEPGKRADFVIHDCGDYREIGYFAGVELAESVCIDGEIQFTRQKG
jgi:imidazolonepropionase